MPPLNRAERNNAFLGFLLLFLITIGIVITVVFFSIKVPFSENEQLRNKMLIMQHQNDLSDSFRVAMYETLVELKKFDLKIEPAIVTKERVQKKIDRMNSLIKNMPDARSDNEKSIYHLVIENLAELNDAKKNLSNEDQKK